MCSRTAATLAITATILAAGGAITELSAQERVDREVIGGRPGRPFSEAVRVGDTYYFSGKIGASSETRAMTEGRTGAETSNIMEAFKGAFERQDLTFDDIVRATVYLADIADYGEMNEVYGSYFPQLAPARVTLAATLVAGARVEISFIAVR